MILDARDEDVSLNRSAQIAIVGAGPSGLVLARELADVASVVVIESGGFGVDERLDALQAGDCIGIDYPLTETRTRQFGGSLALWAGYCATFDPHDLVRRDWVPGSGWPFGHEAIEPFYEKVAGLLNLGEPNFDAGDIASRAGTSFPFENERIVPTVWRFGTPTLRIAEHLREEFESLANFTTLTHANVVDIRLDAEHSMVNELVVRTLGGREGRIVADIFVLAGGGIETPRILLNANTQVSHGLGNSNDMVGRCFMEHPHLTIASLALHDTRLFDGWIERGRYDDDRQFLSCMGLSAQTQEELKVLNARGHVYRTPAMRADEPPKVGIFMEQAPNPNSRVTLSERRDSVGMRRIRLDWQLTDLDWKTYEETARLFAEEFERIGAGRRLGSRQPSTRDVSAVLHSNHHLGTTRMSTDEADGVVDPNCRVHDYRNLYIAGGSVFPTVSWANPTFTLISLIYRLAGYLRNEVVADR